MRGWVEHMSFRKINLRMFVAVSAVLISIVYISLTFSIKIPLVVDILGPRFFPITLGVIFFIFSTIFLWNEVRDFRTATAAAPAQTMRTVRTILGTLTLLFLFITFVEFLGYFLTSFFFVLFFLRISRFGTWLSCTIFAGCLAGVFQMVFSVWLSVPLPTLIGWI